MARILGIDIGTHAVRGTILKTAIKKIELEQYLEVPLAAASDPEGRAEAIREAVKTLLAGAGRPPDRVIASLDGREASLRVVSLPGGAAKRAAEVLPFELESLLPFAPEDAIIDHQPIDQTAGEVRLLAAAVPKERIAMRLAELADAGLDPRELAVGAAALDALPLLVPSLAAATPTLIIEVGVGETNLCMLVNGRCEMARTLSAGVEGAESGLLEAELKRTLLAHRASGGVEPEQILLAGEVAADPNAAGWLAERLGKDVSAVPLPPGPGAGDMGIGRFARAAALAARTTGRTKRLDLRKGEFTPVKKGGAIAQHGKLLAACAGVVLTAFMFSVWARWAVLDSERETLMAELSRVTEQSFGEETSSAERARELVERGPRSNDPMPKFDAYDILDAVSSKIPDDIVHNTRRLFIELDDDGNGGRFELQGRVASVAERDRIAEELEGHECFREIEKGRTSPAGTDGLNYQIEATVRCPGAPEPADDRRSRSRQRSRR